MNRVERLRRVLEDVQEIRENVHWYVSEYPSLDLAIVTARDAELFLTEMIAEEEKKTMPDTEVIDAAPKPKEYIPRPESEQKVCPLFRMAANANPVLDKQSRGEHDKCIRERCEWWIPAACRCVFVANISLALKIYNSALTTAGLEELNP